VAVGGRRTDLLARLAGEGFATAEIDVTDAESVTRARDEVLQHPDRPPHLGPDERSTA
jgi:hypothetical protein